MIFTLDYFQLPDGRTITTGVSDACDDPIVFRWFVGNDVNGQQIYRQGKCATAAEARREATNAIESLKANPPAADPKEAWAKRLASIRTPEDLFVDAFKRLNKLTP